MQMEAFVLLIPLWYALQIGSEKRRANIDKYRHKDKYRNKDI